MKTASRVCRRFTGHRHHSRYGRFSVTHQRLVEPQAFTRASPRVAGRRKTPVAATEVQNASRPEVNPLARVLVDRRRGRSQIAMTVMTLVVRHYTRNGTRYGTNNHGDNPAEPTKVTETEESLDRLADGEDVTRRGPRLQIHSLQRRHRGSRLQIHSLQRGHRHRPLRALRQRGRCLQERRRLR